MVKTNYKTKTPVLQRKEKQVDTLGTLNNESLVEDEFLRHNNI